MKWILSLAGLLVCCTLLTTCGTFRAIGDDYEEDYIIRDIRPLAGVSGEQVTFEASICATAGSLPIDDEENPPHYVWNFGGGAYPNVSYEAKPQVVLRDGIRSPYSCNLTVRDGCLEENVVTADFVLNVGSLSVAAVAPLIAAAGSTTRFNAVIGSGNVTQYTWDFGDACEPSSSSDASPSVKVTDASGPKECRLIINNDYELFEFPFTLVVMPHNEGSGSSI